VARNVKESDGDTKIVSDTDGASSIDADAALPNGEVVGNYRIVDHIASGGFGSVFRAQREDDGEMVALKILHADKITEELVRRFHREVHVMKKLQHPNVIKFYELGVHRDGRPFLTMELLEGVSLRARLQERRLSPEEALAYLRPLCSALEAAHEQGIVHRDIKPSNVFVKKEPDGTERIILLDFGIAKLHDTESVQLTTSRHTVGSPTTMAPEQVRRGNVGPPADIYGLGMLAFRMVAGRNPFQEASPLLLQHLHLNAKPPAPSQFAPLARKLDDVILKSLQKNPELRQKSAREFLEEFEAAIGLPAVTSAATEKPADALVVYVEVVTNGADADDPDDALLDDMETVLTLSRGHLQVDAYQEVIETNNSVLLVRPIKPEDSYAALAKDIWTLVSALNARPNRDQRVHFNVCVHTCEDAMVGNQVVNQTEVTQLTTWTKSKPLNGVIGTEASAKRLAAKAIPIQGADGLFELQSS
jgi:serine/threonine-protein kinase